VISENSRELIVEAAKVGRVYESLIEVCWLVVAALTSGSLLPIAL
jgi:hypothetical protein